MSFTTGPAQRRGIASATRGTSYAHVSQTPYPATDLLRQPEGQFRASTKRRRTTSIGEDGATGLVIHGSHDIDPMEGQNPDGTTPPISGASLYDPDFPVSYNGRGKLKFVSPIRIASIEGPVNTTGSIYAGGDVYANGNPLTPLTDIQSWDVQIGDTGAGANFTKDIINSTSTYMQVQDHISLQVHYVWSDKSTVGDNDIIYIKNLPFVLENQVHKQVIHIEGVTPIQLGSYFLIEGAAGASELKLQTAAGLGFGANDDITGGLCESAGSMTFSFHYHGVIPP